MRANTVLLTLCGMTLLADLSRHVPCTRADQELVGNEMGRVWLLQGGAQCQQPLRGGDRRDARHRAAVQHDEVSERM